MLEIFFVSELKFSKRSAVHGHSAARGNVRPRTEIEHGGGDNNNDIYIYIYPEETPYKSLSH